MIAYTQALLVDTKALQDAQEANDVAKAQEILQQAYRTDVRPIVAEARLQNEAALAPLQLFREQKIREQLIKARGEKTVATGL
jgi:L-rhamnose isomerase/sugar isomerase